MARRLEKLDAVPADHPVTVISWQLLNNFNSDSVEETRTFTADQSIVVIVRNAGAFADITVSDGVGDARENLASGQVLHVHVTGFGNKVSYTITVKAKNLTNKLTGLGAPLLAIVTVRTLAALPPPPPPQPRPPQPPVPPPPGPVPRIHVVKPGDYLRKLARLYYGDENRWTAIYQANKGTIGSNPNLIYAGQRLTIP